MISIIFNIVLIPLVFFLFYLNNKTYKLIHKVLKTQKELTNDMKSIYLNSLKIILKYYVDIEDYDSARKTNELIKKYKN